MPDLVKLHNLAGQLREKRQGARPRAVRSGWFDIRNAVGDETPVYLYDMIGEDWFGDGINPMDFVNEIGRIKTGAIKLHIASEGGDVFDGLAIYEALQQHPSEVRVTVDSLAASAASFIAMAAAPGKLTMARNARLMMHDAAMGGAYGGGTAADMRTFAEAVVEMADLLDDLSLNIADIYAQRAGGTPEEWRSKMQAGVANGGTWYSAQDAISAGLADGITGEETTDAPATEDTAVEDAFDLSALVATIEGAWSA